MEILRFGPGHRHLEPLAGTRGLQHQTIWADERARVTELAFSRHAVLGPQSSPHAGLFIVVAGGGWVQVGDERTSINHGEAVEWPPGVAHGAWTDGSTMRALLVELPDLASAPWQARPERLANDRGQAGDGGPAPARGRLADRPVRPEDHDRSEGEPW